MTVADQTHEVLLAVDHQGKEVQDVAPKNTEVERFGLSEGGELTTEQDRLAGFPDELDLGFDHDRTNSSSHPCQRLGCWHWGKPQLLKNICAQNRSSAPESVRKSARIHVPSALRTS